MNEFLSKILEILKELNIKPIIYGSFGVSLYLGDFKKFEDIDILIEDEFINDRWIEFRKLFELKGFNLVDEKEHEFELEGKRVGFASKNILIKDKIISDFSELVQYKDKDTFTLTPDGFLKVYKFTVKDGYRINTRGKKDRDIIERLEIYITDNKDRIKVIIFDFIGVLLFTSFDYKPNNIVDEIDYDIGKVINDKLFKKETMKKYSLNEKEFNSILNKIINKYKPFEPLWNLLPELKKKYKLAIINNGTSLTLPEFKRKYNIDGIFDLFVSSAIEGLRKPDKDIYQLTVDRLGVKPEECLFMDDSIQNIKGANKIGMNTIYWENSQIGFTKFKEFLNII